MAQVITQSALKLSHSVLKRGVVLLDLEEYQRLNARAVPTYYLHGKAAERLDQDVESALKEHRLGKTISARSLTQALKLYGQSKKNKKSRVLEKVS